MVTRFAPSPTGFLHLGHAYAAFQAWDEARRANGQFLLRLEDIDVARCRSYHETALLEDLAWLGLSWPKPVWRQSERMPVYKKSLDRLERLGLIYPCFCSRAELAAIDAPQGPDGVIYPGTCRQMFHVERQ